MRKLTFTIIGLMLFFAANSQSFSANMDSDPNPSNNTNMKSSSKGAWTVQFTHHVYASGMAGCETDGSYFYVTKWNGDSIYKYNLQGTLVSGFTIPGVTGLRDLAFDGTYFYGGKASTVIYKMDFNSTPPSLVSSITSPVNVRNICYDPAANNNDGGFWVGDWSTDLKLVSRTGTTLSTIASTSHGLNSTYGTAYDDITPGGPFIWAISATSAENTTIRQIKVSTGTQTGIAHDATTDITVAGNLGGGLWIQPNIVGSTVTLGGLIQNSIIFGYDLASVIPDSFDLAVNNLDVGALVPLNQNVDIKGQIKNFGLMPITSFNLYYSVDGGTPVVQNVTGVNIASMGTYNYNHSTPWTPTAGSHTIHVWTANPNGVPDQFTGNDTLTANTVAYDPTSSVPRVVLMETFTSSTCAPCVNGNIVIQNILDANVGKWACVKYQMSWPGTGDPYYTAEGGTRRNFYGVSSVPHQYIDGGYDGNSSSATQADFDAAYNTPAFVGLEATMVIDTNTHHLNVGVTVDPKMSLPATTKLHVAIVEQRTTKNKKSNGETEFFWVMKKMLPNASGTTVQGPANTPINEYFGYTFQGNYRLPSDATTPINHATEHSVEGFSDLTVVCWVQDNNTKVVHQAAIGSVYLGIAENYREDLISSYFPNPATDNVNFTFNLDQAQVVEVSIINNMGQEVRKVNLGMVNSGSQQVTIDVNDLSEGIYYFKFFLNNAIYTKPVMVK
ncbi:MAG: T9SS type A sorting domain-containing protein [Bacteroidales bacterium]|nr:T9SS type A sorting domain-containing protein [Bacteroidales bacterium]